MTMTMADESTEAGQAPEPQHDAPRPGMPVVSAVLFTVTSFVGACLLFLVQPMVTKVVLPLFGGSPAVWNTSNLFFQVSLLAGYVLTHLSIRRFGVRRQSVLQVGLVLLPLAVLPIGLPADAERPSGLATVLWLLVVLTATVGAPFLVLSTVGPLLQRWFGATSHPRAQDPYFLFAAGNTGSLAALVAYPALVEPRFGLDLQLRLWSWGYCGFALLLIGCAVVLKRTPAARTSPTWVDSVPEVAPSLRQRLRWVALAALASSLMLGVTTHLSTDLTPMPLLWVLPLALYLVTFIVAFALSRPRADVLSRRLSLLLPALVVPVVLAATGTALPLLAQVTVHLALFTVAALAAHARLAAERPGVSGLTGFYLLLAAGGALGGAANALVAPLVLDRFYEYPLAIVLALLLLPGARRKARSGQRGGRPGALLLALLAVLSLPSAVVVLQEVGPLSGWTLVTAVSLAMVSIGWLARQRTPFALATALMLVAPLVASGGLVTERTFFGVQQVRAVGGVHTLVHGNTVHGVQDVRPGRVGEPRSYYHREGPLGQVFSAFSDDPSRRAGAQLGFVGLGTGALAAYAQDGQTATFFEIDPATVEIAQDKRLFRYLADSRADVDIVLGDGRLSLAAQPAGRFDMLVVDAFSSDAIPVHLLTREAVDLYASRLADEGLLVFHISNRYLDLGPVLADISSSLGLSGVVRHDLEQDVDEHKNRSVWVVLGRDEHDLRRLADDGRWRDLTSVRRGERPWTDDYSNVLGTLLHGVPHTRAISE